jgi:methylated-DNA-protein-cysteine methyltransferase related protein
MTEEIIEIIKSIPRGKVATYGQIARLAGYPNGARQVVRILHTCSEKYDLPWHRVINIKGEIALSIYNGADEQKALLENEGITFLNEYKVDMQRHLMRG